VALSIAARLNVGITTLMSGRPSFSLRVDRFLRLDIAADFLGLARSWTTIEPFVVFFKRIAGVKAH